MRKQWWSGIALLVAALFLGKIIHFSQKNTPAPWQNEMAESQSPFSESDALVVEHATPATDTGFITGLEDLPPSFRGTQPDGGLATDHQGNLLIHHDIRLLFDYFLAGYGEESLDVIAARIRAYIRFHLQEPAATQANQLLDDYLALQNQLSSFDRPESRPGSDLDSIAAQLQTIRDIRRHHLSSEAADAFFGEEETYDHYTLEKIRIMNDEQLNPDEKTQLIADLESQLPEELQGSLIASYQAVALRNQTQQLREQGGTAGELHQLRSELAGDAAAERLAQLDQTRTQWNDKITEWLHIREHYLQNPQLSQSDTYRQLAQLRSEHFNASELRRVEALERIQDEHTDRF